MSLSLSHPRSFLIILSPCWWRGVREQLDGHLAAHQGPSATKMQSRLRSLVITGMVDSHRYSSIRPTCCPLQRGMFLWLCFFYAKKETAVMWVSTELAIFSCPVGQCCVDIAYILCLDRYYMTVSTVIEPGHGR